MHRRRSLVVTVLFSCVCLLLAAGGAQADTATIGEINLSPSSANLDTTGMNIPVFQGDASGNYVLTVPQNGTITSWSFLSGGASTGSTFVLRRLETTAGGTMWEALGTSSPQAVTSTTGTDAVNGPFATSIPVIAGDRIALEPVNGSSIPIETGTLGQDGIRYFAAPFADGSSSALAPGATADSGQVVPIQATETFTTAVAPPANTAAPTISGQPTAPSVLSCSTGTWTNAPVTFTYQWMRDGQNIDGATGQTFQIAPGDSGGYQVTCAVTASNGGGSATVTSAPQAIPDLSPRVLTQPTIRGTTYDRKRRTHLAAAGDRLTCDPGTWANATPFREVWWADVAEAAVGPFAGGPGASGVSGIQRVAFAIGSSVVVPDYPSSIIESGVRVRTHTVITDIQCQVDAASTVGLMYPHAIAVVAGSTADKVYIRALAPRLDLPRSPKQHCTSVCGPTISPAVGYGQVNKCMPGRWLHYPTSFKYEWLLKRVAGSSGATIISRKQDLRISFGEERHYLLCRVTAANSAGMASSDSNGYEVPDLGFAAEGNARIYEEQPGPPGFVPPSSSDLDALTPDSTNMWRFSCRAPNFNKAVSSINYYWIAYWGSGAVSVSATDPVAYGDDAASLGDVQERPPTQRYGAGAPVTGVFLDIDASANLAIDPVLLTTVGGLNSVRNFPLRANGGSLVIGCYVYATAQDGQQALADSAFTWVGLPDDPTS
jgi:hypothetical protein